MVTVACSSVSVGLLFYKKTSNVLWGNGLMYLCLLFA